MVRQDHHNLENQCVFNSLCNHLLYWLISNFAYGGTDYMMSYYKLLSQHEVCMLLVQYFFLRLTARSASGIGNKLVFHWSSPKEQVATGRLQCIKNPCRLNPQDPCSLSCHTEVSRVNVLHGTCAKQPQAEFMPVLRASHHCHLKLSGKMIILPNSLSDYVVLVSATGRQEATS